MTTPRLRRRGRKRKRQPVRLQLWLDANGFTSAQLEDAASICRQTMTEIRAGRDTRQNTMRKVLHGARRLANRPVRIEELFEFDFESDDSAGRESAND